MRLLIWSLLLAGAVQISPGCANEEVEDDETPATETAAGVYRAAADGSTPDALLLLDGEGRFVVFNASGDAFDFASGTASPGDGAWSRTDVSLLQKRGETVVQGTLAIDASYTLESTATLTLSDADTGVAPIATPLPLVFDAVSRDGASLDAVTGTYTVSGAGNASISRSGRVSGLLATLCSIDGDLTVTEPSRNVYTLNASFTGRGCDALGIATGTYLLLGWREGSDLRLFGRSEGVLTQLRLQRS